MPTFAKNKVGQIAHKACSFRIKDMIILWSQCIDWKVEKQKTKAHLYVLVNLYIL